MEIRSFDDIMKFRDEFAHRLEARMKALEKPGIGTVDELIEEKRVLVKQTRTRMQALERAKAALLKRHDEEMSRHKQAIGELERELEELGKARPGGGNPPRSRKKRA
jgi:hypothetical protein